MINRLGIGFIAMIVAMSLLLSPANAVAMIDCEVQQSSLAVDLAGHGDHVNHASVEQDQGGAGHVSEHCAAHACVVATESVAIAAAIVLVVQSAELNIHSGPLVPISVPEGLRRPPRA
jgi:hypothetical protein